MCRCCFFQVGDKADSEVQRISALRLRAAVWKWYSEVLATAPPDFTKLEDLRLSFFGSRENPHFGAKAAETKSLVPFFLQLLEDKFRPLTAKATTLMAAGKALVAFIRLCKTAGASPGEATCKVLSWLALV